MDSENLGRRKKEVTVYRAISIGVEKYIVFKYIRIIEMSYLFVGAPEQK